MSTQEVNLTTDRTNCTTTEREEATWRMVGGAETWIGEEMDSRYCREGVMVADKGGVGNVQGNRKNTSPNPLAEKNRGADFCKLLQPAGLKN